MRTGMKWILFAILFFTSLFLQFTPGVFAVSGAKPLAVLVFVVAVSAVCGLRPGWASALAGGLFWDVTAGVLFGSAAIFLFLVSTAVSLLFAFYLKQNLLNVLFCAAAAFILYAGFSQGIAALFLRAEALLSLSRIFWTGTYSILILPIFYYPVKWLRHGIKRRGAVQ